MTTTSIFITGVGGQGTILASELLSDAALEAGFDVKKSEVHGMAQRGGSVVGTVRFGEKVFSPVISPAEADVLLAFEPLEALRTLHYVKPTGKVVVNTRPIMPATVASGSASYPPNVFELIRDQVPDVLIIDGFELARQAGTVKAVNVVLLGALSKFLPFDEAHWQKVIAARVPAKFLDANMRAFLAGRNF